MISKLGKEFGCKIQVARDEANFDRAYDAARDRAVDLCQVDEDGHSKIEGWDRSSCRIVIEFISLSCRIGMTGDDLTYEFLVWAEAIDTDDDDDDDDWEDAEPCSCGK